MSGWSYQTQPPAEGAVRLLLAGQVGFTNALYNALAGDARFDIVSIATDPQDLQQKLATYAPEAVVIEVSIFPGPDELVAFLNAAGEAVCYLVLPPDTPAETTQRLQAHRRVMGVWQGRVSFIELAQKVRDDVEATRQARLLQFGGAQAWGAQRIVGTRILTVWNQIGGKGGTTIASNLAYAAARNGVATLLVGLGAPDDLPLVMGLQRSPNILMFKNNPTPEGFRASIQKKELLDVIPGFPDAISAAEFAMMEDGLPALVDQAISAGYAFIVIDAPQQELAPLAIAICNQLLVVAKPTLADAYRTAEALRMVAEKIEGKFRLAPGAIRMALNSPFPDRALSPDEWRQAVVRLLGGRIVPPLSVVDYDPKVPAAQNEGKMPLLVADGFRRQIEQLLREMGLEAAERKSTGAEAPHGEVTKIGPIKIRWG